MKSSVSRLRTDLAALLVTLVYFLAGPAAADAIASHNVPSLASETPCSNICRALSRRLSQLARAQQQGGDLVRAAFLLRKALRVDPTNGLAYATRADLRSLRGDDLGAVGDADYAVGLEPKRALIYYYRGVVLSRMNLWASAAADFHIAAHLDPASVNAHYSLGWAMLAQGRHADAVVSLSRAIGHISMPAPAYFLRSHAYALLGNIDAAISDINAVIQSIPRYPEAHHRRAHLFMRKGYDAAALTDLAAAILNDPEDLLARTDLAYLCRLSGSRISQCQHVHMQTSPWARAFDHAAHFDLAR